MRSVERVHSRADAPSNLAANGAVPADFARWMPLNGPMCLAAKAGSR